VFVKSLDSVVVTMASEGLDEPYIVVRFPAVVQTILSEVSMPSLGPSCLPFNWQWESFPCMKSDRDV